MYKFSKQKIDNTIVKSLSDGRSNKDILDTFLMMKMENDLYQGEGRRYTKTRPKPEEIECNLAGNGVIESKDIHLEKGSVPYNQMLHVTLSKECFLYVESVSGIIYARVNDNPIATMALRDRSAEDIAMWIIRQKENLGSYMDEWDIALKGASKKAKGNRMASLAIKAIFTESMQEYPNIKYDFIEQKKRLRIRVKLQNKLGIMIDAWWGSYKKTLPGQIDDLKQLIEVHAKVGKMTFFVSHR